MILMQSQDLDHFCFMLLLYDVLSESCSVSLLTESASEPFFVRRGAHKK